MLLMSTKLAAYAAAVRRSVVLRLSCQRGAVLFVKTGSDGAGAGPVGVRRVRAACGRVRPARRPAVGARAPGCTPAAPREIGGLGEPFAISIYGRRAGVCASMWWNQRTTHMGHGRRTCSWQHYDASSMGCYRRSVRRYQWLALHVRFFSTGTDIRDRRRRNAHGCDLYSSGIRPSSSSSEDDY
eukprot:COSAG02_NODE_726_length_18005_cov_69.224897_11_plen_184_part_00